MMMRIVCADGVVRELVKQDVGRGNLSTTCRVCGTADVWCGQWYTDVVDSGVSRRFGAMVCEPCGSVRKMS